VSQWQPTDAQWTQANQLLPEHERVRISKFIRPTADKKTLTGKDNNDAKLSLAGLLLTRKLVHERLHVPYSSVNIERTKERKTHFKHPSNFNFNVSHHHQLVVLAADWHVLVGVDVMNVELPRTSVVEYFDLMNNCFTVHEWQQIRAGVDDRDRMRLFATFWTLKEALIKALGIGLGFDLQRAEFTLTPVTSVGSDSALTARATVKIEHEARSDWFFNIYRVKEHIVSVAHGPPNDTCQSFKDLWQPNFNVQASQAHLDRLKSFSEFNIEQLLEQ
jgi:4'-phosphopantetheinyl transferase